MNQAQRLWWRQSRSDHELFQRLRGPEIGAQDCHLLHYLQMATEKLCKAYLWRTGRAPRRSHTGLVQFWKSLLLRPDQDLERIAPVLTFPSKSALVTWARTVQPLAHELGRLAPAESGDGPNPEYPWPHSAPTSCPADYSFDLWRKLSTSARGRQLLKVIDHAVVHFDVYA